VKNQFYINILLLLSNRPPPSFLPPERRTRDMTCTAASCATFSPSSWIHRLWCTCRNNDNYKTLSVHVSRLHNHLFISCSSFPADL